MATPNSVRKVYNTVVEDVIANVREAFLDEGVDEQVLQELKQLWESKLAQSRALEPAAAHAPDHKESLLPNTIPFQMMPQQQQKPQQTRVPQQQQATIQQQIPVPIQIGTDGQLSGPAAMAFNAQGGMFQQQLQALVNVNSGQITLQQTANGQYIIQAMPQQAAGQQMISIPQQAVITTQPNTAQIQQQIQTNPGIPQVDGAHDTSSSEDDNYDDNDNDDENDDEKDNEAEDNAGEEEEPLNSEDDVSEEDPTELFDTDNVVVCQFEKISRNKSKWKFHLKDGIMNLNGKDYVFQKGIGEADW